MLHSKFQGHWPFGSGEEDFFRFLPYMDMASILVMWPGLFEHTSVPPSHSNSMWNVTLIGPVVSEEKMFKTCGRQRMMTYNWGLPILYAHQWAFRSGELKHVTHAWTDKPTAICSTNFFKVGGITMGFYHRLCIHKMQGEWQAVQTDQTALSGAGWSGLHCLSLR